MKPASTSTPRFLAAQRRDCGARIFVIRAARRPLGATSRQTSDRRHSDGFYHRWKARALVCRLGKGLLCEPWIGS